MNFSHRPKCHYETLGVAKDATMEEIKAAFRKLSLETHPDVAGASVNPERFKSISHAASVLTNIKLKQVYDDKQRASYNYLSSHFTNSQNYHRHSSSGSEQHVYRHANSTGGYNATTPWLVHIFRPRNLFFGPILLFVGVSSIQYMFGVETNSIEANKKLFPQDDKATMVQAWLNPQSGRYETPAPWDPIYQQLQPELQYVPRNQVQSRTR